MLSQLAAKIWPSDSDVESTDTDAFRNSAKFSLTVKLDCSQTLTSTSLVLVKYDWPFEGLGTQSLATTLVPSGNVKQCPGIVGTTGGSLSFKILKLEYKREHCPSNIEINLY